MPTDADPAGEGLVRGSVGQRQHPAPGGTEAFDDQRIEPRDPGRDHEGIGCPGRGAPEGIREVRARMQLHPVRHPGGGHLGQPEQQNPQGPGHDGSW